MTTAADWSHADAPPPAPLAGTVYDLKALAVAGFAVRTPLKGGGCVHVVLGQSEGVTGRVQSTPESTRIEAKTEAHLTLSRVYAETKQATVDVATALVLGTVAVDFVIPKDQSTTGRAQADRMTAPTLTVAGLIGLEEVTLENVVAQGVDIRLEVGRTMLTTRSMTVQTLELATPRGPVTLGDIEVENLVVELSDGDSPIVSVGAVRSGEVVGPLPSGSIGLRGVSLQNIGLARSGALRIEAASCDAVTTTWRRSSTRSQVEHAAAGPIEVPVDLSFLDGLDGHVNADIGTHIRIPIIPDWRAVHRIRVEVDRGTVDYEKLEHGIGKLPDAVLDFKLDGDRLCLDKDIPLVPFDRRTLLSWPLPSEDERSLARRGRIRLARLLHPHIEIERKVTGRDEGSRFLEEIRIRDIDVAVSLAADAGMALPSGGTLRLGGTGTGAVPAVERATLRGELVMRPDDRNPVGSLLLEAVGVVVGLGALPVGERHLDVGTATFGRVSGELKTRDFTVQQIHAALSSIRVEDVCVAPS